MPIRGHGESTMIPGSCGVILISIGKLFRRRYHEASIYSLDFRIYKSEK